MEAPSRPAAARCFPALRGALGWNVSPFRHRPASAGRTLPSRSRTALVSMRAAASSPRTRTGGSVPRDNRLARPERSGSAIRVPLDCAICILPAAIGATRPRPAREPIRHDPRRVRALATVYPPPRAGAPHPDRHRPSTNSPYRARRLSLLTPPPRHANGPSLGAVSSGSR